MKDAFRFAGWGLARRIPVFIAALIATGTPASAHDARDGSIDVADLAEHADFVFKGTVTNVAYRDSAPNPLLDANGRPVVDRSGVPVLQDGSGLAHTFVTFSIDRIYKGKANEAEVTLRFRGGVQEDLVAEPDESGSIVMQEEVYLAGDSPLFDIGDRDILFVERNTDKPLPLAGGSAGRFRLINRDPGSFADEQVYGNLGREISRLDSPTPGATPSAGLGPSHELPEVNSTTMGGSVLHRLKGPDPVVQDSEGDAAPDPLPAAPPQFLEADFDDFLADVVVDDPALPAVVSADITLPFFGRPIHDVRPAPKIKEDKRPMARPWLDELSPEERRQVRQQERAEKKAFKLSGGSPVLVVPQ